MKNALMLSGLFAGLSSLPAMAQEGLKTIGKPVDGGLNFQPAATSLMEGIHKLDWMILVIITVICVFVAGLLLWAILRFNKRANPAPANFSHYTPIEIAWTVIPILVLVFIGSFSLPQLFAQQEIPEGDINIKVTGYQWYWGYEYSDHEFGFESFMLPKDQLAANGYAEDEYLLATDTAVVVPSGKTIVMNVT
ncbi:MAG: cytochrome c oxidase subunit II, partial [Rhodobacteraceae bacterium]|nr:cytochrome c oxidase subunit II [Paracoccaceae bacterium]